MIWYYALLKKNAPPLLSGSFWEGTRGIRAVLRVAVCAAAAWPIAFGLGLLAAPAWTWRLMDNGGIVAACILFIPAIVAQWWVPAVAFRRFESQVREHDNLVCNKCGYLLCGLGDQFTCPECGSQYEAVELREYWERLFKKPGKGRGTFVIDPS